jgi:hypothetical protein
MAAVFSAAELASFESPDEIRSFDRGRAEVVTVGGAEIGRYTLEPGFRWIEDLEPIAGEEWCKAPHFQYHVSGILRIRLTDGSEFDAGPGTIVALPTPHVGWVVGDQPAVVIDWWGILDFARQRG